MGVTGAGTATVAAVACSTTVATLLAAANGRRMALIYNSTAVDLYVKFGATATSSDYTVKLAAGDFYELPVPMYTGVITGILASSTGDVRVTSW